MYHYPGVYIEHVPSGLLAIEAASTSVAAFIGPLGRGPLQEPTFVAGVTAFALQFGALNDPAGGIRDLGDQPDKFGHAVNAFYGNGGNKAYIVRVPAGEATASAVMPNPADATRGFRLEAANPGAWGNDLVVRLAPMDSGSTPDLSLGYSLAVGSIVDGSFTAIEQFDELSSDPASSKFITSAVNGSSSLIIIEEGVLDDGAGGGIGPVTSLAIRGNPVILGGDGRLAVGGRSIVVRVGDADPVTVSFEADTGDLRALAQKIEAEVRAAVPAAPDFTARMEREGSERRLVLRSGFAGDQGNVQVADPPPLPSAREQLGLEEDPVTMPPQDLSEGGSIEAFFTQGIAVIPFPGDSERGFRFTTRDPNAAPGLLVRLKPKDSGSPPDLSQGYSLELGRFQDGSFLVLEGFTDLSLDDSEDTYIEKVVNDNSALVTLATGKLEEPDNFGPVTSLGIRGKPVTLSDSGMLEVGGRGIDISIGGSEPVMILFEEHSDDVSVLARQIQEQVRAARPEAPNFTARVESDGSEHRIVLWSGLVGPAGDVSVSDPAPRSAVKALGLDATATPMPPVNLAGGGVIEVFFNGGSDGTGVASLADYQKAFEKLRDYRDVSILLLPGLEWVKGGDNGIIEAALTHAEFMQNRMVIVDPPDPAEGDPLVSPKDVRDLGAPTSPYSALYYPWLRVANPHHDPDTASSKPKSFNIPPSSFAAGLWARIDASRGVWKAPAGLEASLRGTIGPNVLIGNELQGNLNDQGVNCLRAIIGPTVIWGARTLATRAKPEFRYISVRRTQNMIGESLYNALQAVVFEPNDHRLWGSLRASVTDFMDGLFRAGAFQGAKASEAYYVQCGLGSTMTQGDIDAGIVRVVVGFAPLKPAEFVVVQIKQIVGQTA